jgi:hypothetical protein
MNLAFAFDIHAMEDMLMSQEVVEGVFSNPIAQTSESGDLTGEIAPPTKVITTSSGDIIINSAEGATAQISKTQEGLTEVTYNQNGVAVKVQNEDTGETMTYFYELDGAQVRLVNQAGETVQTRLYTEYGGELLSVLTQGKVEYQYAEDNAGNQILVSSTDQWGNKTTYDDEGRPQYIFTQNADGTYSDEPVGEYKFNQHGRLEYFIDHNDNKTVFYTGGILEGQVERVENYTGTVIKRYVYGTDTVLDYVEDVISGSRTYYEGGKAALTYDVILETDDQGNLVVDGNGDTIIQDMVVNETYNYDARGYLASVTTHGEEGVVTGWTDYDDLGRAEATYNQEGVLVQLYDYNDFGFLYQTRSFGGINDYTGMQEITSVTVFDKQGRPAEVWQIGDGGNRVKIQEYEYREDGVLSATYSLGIIRNTDQESADFGQPILDAAGNFQYIKTSKTEFDKKGRPQAVYAIVRDDNGDIMLDNKGEAIMEKQQVYRYNSRGFLDETITYGFKGRVTGKTSFDRYGRPQSSSNSQGSETQLFVYGSDGFLDKTINKGENGVETGYTLYNDKGKPTDVFNHKDSLVQKYVYDEYGMLVKSYTLSGEDGVNDMIAATLADENAILQLWDASYTGEAIAATGGNLSESAFVTAMFNAFNSGDYELAEKISLTIIMWFGDGADGGNQYNINSVGTAYHMLGQALEEQGDYDTAVSAYKVQISKYNSAEAYNASGTAVESVTSWSLDKLSNSTNLPEVNTATITGETVFGGDGKPIVSYSYYEKFDDNGNSMGIQKAKTQEFIYSYEANVKVDTGQVDSDGQVIYETQTVTKHSNFVQKTINFGDFNDSGEQVVTGYTIFDDYGRQNETYNDEDQLIQKYNYSANGFLKTTASYGANKRMTGITVFDNYSRPVAAFNNYGSGANNIPEDLIAALSDGLQISFDEQGNAEWPDSWQPHLKGLTQTFVYGDDGFLQESLTWGEATVMDANKLDKFSESLGSVRGDLNYSTEFDFDNDGDVDGTDQTALNDAFSGASDFIAAFGSVAGDSNYNAAFDYDSDGDVDKTDNGQFGRNAETRTKYMPTYTGKTTYDKYGKAQSVENSEGIIVQRYVYNERGFMTRSESYGPATDANGNIQLDGNGDLITIMTGYTEFDEKSKPVATYSVYDNGVDGQQTALVQEYVYDKGFLVQTNNYGRADETGAPTLTGHTEFDDYGRQKATYNEEGNVISKYVYSTQGFLKQTNNYGLRGAYTGKTLFGKNGRPTEAFNMAASNSGLKGLTQTFNYNEYGFLESSISYGENQTMTGKTIYDGYGKAIRGENDMGMTVSSYIYDSQGFMLETQSLAFVADDSASGQWAVTEVHQNLNDDSDPANGDLQTGYYTITGKTVFDNYSRPTESYQCYWADEDTGEYTFVRIQSYNYEGGFLSTTTNYGSDGTTITGMTKFDRYGRQEVSLNEFDEKTTAYRYSSQGFLSEAHNYGSKNSFTGKTVFNDLGRPEASYNNRGVKVQSFNYNAFTGSMESSYSYGEPGEDGSETITGTTLYDAYGKATEQVNEYGMKVADYNYDAAGFMTRANSYGNNEVLTGYTEYGIEGRPVSSYQVSEQGIATKVQDFVYNTNVAGDPSDLQYVGQPANTGFLTETISYGDNNTFSGYTTFNRYGQQEKSFNELGEQTTVYRYSRNGFLSETLNYGVNRSLTGKTVFNKFGRPEAAYNERGVQVQSFTFTNGFLTSSTSYGDPGEGDLGPVTGTTFYNDWGKQTYTENGEGSVVSRFHYNERGFLVQSDNIAVNDDGYEQLVGYTLYNDLSRPTQSYSVYNNGSGDQSSLAQVFVYNTDWDGKSEFSGSANTGFVTGAMSYSTEDDGTSVYNGSTVYNRYGRPEISYNHLGYQTSRNYYSKNGFIAKTINYGEGRTITGYLYYDATGKPTEAANFRNVVTTTYHYNDRGQLTQTVNYQEGVVTGYTTFDVFSKATGSYQCFSSASDQNGSYYVPYNGSNGNYTINDDGTISGGFKNQENIYNAYGKISETISYGKSGAITSRISYDAYSRPSQIHNAEGSLVQEYTYSDQGFLLYTTSSQKMNAYDDQGNENPDNTWETETTRTYFNKYGQQTETYLMNGDVVGAIQSKYQYDSSGFLFRSTNYADGAVSGWVTFDASGRQNYSYNASGEQSGYFRYNDDGFLTRSVSTQ